MTSKYINLTNKFELQDREAISDGAGGEEYIWKTIGTIWGKLITGSGRKKNSIDHQISLTTYKVIVRSSNYKSNGRPLPGQRLKNDYRSIIINSVSEYDDRGMYLICFAQEEKGI